MSFGFLENQQFNHTASDVYMFSMIFALTLVVVFSLTGFRKQIQFYYFYYFHAPNQDKPINYLKIRTILLNNVNILYSELL